MGYWSDDSEDVVITHVIGPGPQAVHKRSSFLPDQRYQEAEIARRYDASGRRITYLGDWHTHPRGPLELSAVDRATQLRIALHAKARAPRALMAILAGGAPWHLGVWEVEKRRFWRLKNRALEVLELGEQ